MQFGILFYIEDVAQMTQIGLRYTDGVYRANDESRSPVHRGSVSLSPGPSSSYTHTIES